MCSGIVVSGCGGGKFDACEARKDCPASGGHDPVGPGASGGANAAGGDGQGGAGPSGAGNSATAGSLSAGNGGSGEAGSGDEPGSAGRAPSSCDVMASPRAETCLRTESFAVFVAPDGDDRATGTRAEPYRSLEQAVLVARASGRRVIACQGIYERSLTLTGDEGVMVHGGFDCENDWLPSDDKSVIAPPAGAALVVQDTSAPIVMQDFELRAADATTPSSSSIAVTVARAASLTLSRVTVRSGIGADGLPGAALAYEFPGVESLQGHDATETSGGQGEPCSCPGGPGSHRGAGGAPLQSGGMGLPDTEAGGGEPGDPALSCNGGGGSGADGAPGAHAPAAAGARKLGTLSATVWTPMDGATALPGAPGQGGGGGAGKSGGGGGSGACGGCGGLGGTGGAGGGASIGILSVDSKVILERVTISTARGGNGGNGGAGQTGQPSARGGAGYGTGSDFGCWGGSGGPGGNGGHGGGGAGGLSVGVLHVGEAPTLGSGMTFEVGPAGYGGLGGDEASKADDGVDGRVADTLALEP